MKTLLTQLGWPTEAMHEKGALRWMDSHNAMRACVVRGPAGVTCEIKALDVMEPGPLVHRSVWDANHHLVAFSQHERDQPLDESMAVKTFCDLIQLLNVLPTYTPMGRMRAESAPALDPKRTPHSDRGMA